MSMFTRCTHCDAAFRVSLEQLQLSSGQVRCGVCQRVFDAFVSLSAADPREDDNAEAKKTAPPFAVNTTPPKTIATPSKPAAMPKPSIANSEPSTKPQPARTPAPLPASRPSSPPPLPSERPSITPPPARSAVPPTARTRSTTPTNPFLPDALEIPSALPSSLEIIEVPGISVGFGDAPEPESKAIFPTPRSDTMLRDALSEGIVKPKEVAKQIANRGASTRRWPVWSGVLGALLVLQMLFWFRGSIANAAPEARPVLQGICSVFGCEVPLPRFADRLTIEASDLQALDPTRPNRVVLSATIRNRAPDAQSFPMLELTLTDPRDQVAARKVLAPDEYLDPAVDVREGLASNGEATLRLRLDTGDIEAAGYRIYLFHP